MAPGKVSCSLPDVCFEGRGICDSSTLLCVCGSDYVSKGDLAHATECTVNVLGSRILYGLLLAVWCSVAAATVFASRVMYRKDTRTERKENWILLFMGFFACCYISAGCLVLTSQPYGRRSYGNDAATTAAYALATGCSWIFLIGKPLFAVSGLSASVFDHTGHVKDVYSKLVPVLIVGTTISSVLPFAILNVDAPVMPVVTAFYTSWGIVGLFLTVFTTYALRKVQLNFGTALVSNRDLAYDRKLRMQRYVRRATIMLSIALLCSLCSILTFFALAIDHEVANSYSWIVIPLLFTLNGLWCLRNAINNARLSLELRRRDYVASSNEAENDQDEQGTNDERAQGTPTSMRSSGPSSHRRTRKLRGVRRKPLQIMSAVPERTAEGSVIFTHVDGLEESRVGTATKRMSNSRTNNSEELARLSTRSVGD